MLTIARVRPTHRSLLTGNHCPFAARQGQRVGLASHLQGTPRHTATEQTTRAIDRTLRGALGPRVAQCAYFVHKITKAIRSDGREAVLSLPIIRRARRRTARGCLDRLKRVTANADVILGEP